jgi:type IV pilus assembly protein PilM
MDPVLVAETVRSVVESCGLKKKNVIAAVGGHDVIIKRIQMDRMSENDAREVIRWEAEQHVPFDMENVQLDFQIMNPQSDGVQMSVLLVAAKRELIENRLSLLTDAGLTPATIDVDAFALHNAFELNHPDAMHGLVSLVNIGHDVTNILLMDDGVPLLTRDLTVGTRRIREDLQRERGLPGDEAQALLQGYDRSPHLDAVVESRGEEIAVGIERAAAFLAQNSRGAGLRAIYSSGGGSRIPGLNDMLANRFGLPVQQANPLANVTVRDGALDALVTDEIAPLLMLPIGLALRNVA